MSATIQVKGLVENPNNVPADSPGLQVIFTISEYAGQNGLLPILTNQYSFSAEALSGDFTPIVSKSVENTTVSYWVSATTTKGNVWSSKLGLTLVFDDSGEFRVTPGQTSMIVLKGGLLTTPK